MYQISVAERVRAKIRHVDRLGNANLPMRAIRGQMASAIDVVVQTARMRDGVRRVTEMVELAGLEGDVFSLNPLFTYKFQGENIEGKLMGTFEPSNLRPRFLSRLDYFGLADAFMATMKPLKTEAA